MFRKKSSRKLAVFRVVLQNKGKKRVLWGNGRKKGKAVVKERTVYICHYREISPPLSFNYFLLIIYRGWMSEKKGQDGQRKGADGEKASPTLSGEGPKACANPSGWSRDPFGMESGTRTSGFLMQEN